MFHFNFGTSGLDSMAETNKVAEQGMMGVWQKEDENEISSERIHEVSL